MRAPIAELFSLLPEVMIAQAFHTDFAEFAVPDGEQWFAFWVRVARVRPADNFMTAHNGLALGYEIVAYPCDMRGRVLDWERRYEVTTASTDATEALRKLRALLANGLAPLCNYEGLLTHIETCEAEAARLNWDEMPKGL